jgi:choline dehydrogenase-like flavoprotein
LRENDPISHDPNATSPFPLDGPSRLDIKFSFGNCIDDENEVMVPPPYGCVPEIAFKNLSWMDHLANSRFPALAGWQKSYGQIFAVLNQVTYNIFSQFEINGQTARPENEVWYGQEGKGFGWGTMHHAAGTMRMPFRPRLDASFEYDTVVDEDLRVAGTQNLYVCDMSVMPFASAANPVRTLVALALRLSKHFG